MAIKLIAVFLVAILIGAPSSSFALEAPSAQHVLASGEVLRGTFIERHHLGDSQQAVKTDGYFVAVPDKGLVWNLAQPLPMTTVVTPEKAVQVIGGISIKLPVKNLRHLYDMIAGALMGDWGALAIDYDIAASGEANQWQRILTPRPGLKAKLSYTRIVVTGGLFVETLALTRPDGAIDSVIFSQTHLARQPLSDSESALFQNAE